MAANFLSLVTTPAVLAAQERFTGKRREIAPPGSNDRLGPDEVAFIAARDSFYLASVSESGWPYVQHRGGRPGFLRVLGPSALAFADYRGNHQMLSAGNVSRDNRVALFFMDYPRRERLKLLGRARFIEARSDPARVAAFAVPEDHRLVERIVEIEVVAFDWNCPQYITPRYTSAEVNASIEPLRRRIAELEAQLQTQKNK